MPSNKETLFQAHICQFLEFQHGYQTLNNDELPSQDSHIIAEQLLHFVQTTQVEQFAQLTQNYQTDTAKVFLKALEDEIKKKPLWLVMRSGLMVKGIPFELYKPKPRSQTSPIQEAHYQANQFRFKKEYRYNANSQERIDLVIWLNGLPIIVIELKHEDEGQTVDDAINSDFLSKRDLSNPLFKRAFLFVAASDLEVKVATNLKSEKSFRWFNAQLFNKAETDGQYPVEHLYNHALSKESRAKYLEHFLVFVPAKEEMGDQGLTISQPAFTIFPRYHQLRASQKLSKDVQAKVNENGQLGLKYLINHSAGSGKTLTIAWMADQLDSLYTDDNKKVFDNIVILTDRKSLDKNVRDDLDNFTHLKSKIRFAKKSKQLADHLEKNRDIIVSTIHKFGYIQDRLQSQDALKNRSIAFLIDEAHRSQEGKMALKMRVFFTEEGDSYETEEDEPANFDDVADTLERLNISNQVFVSFTATTTPKTVNYFGTPFDIYSEEEAIQEGYILDVAQNIISYNTLYNLQLKEAIPAKDYPAGVVAQALKNIAFSDQALIQYKAEVMIKLFLEHVVDSIEGKGKSMVVASSRPAGLIYFNTINTILSEKKLPFKALFAFSDYLDVEGNSIEEIKVNQLDTLHSGKLIEDVFDTDDYRILIVANKFQTGFDQPLLSSMFLDKAVNGVNAIQTVSRLNRKHDDKYQDDILVVDFTNNADNIFKAFNQHRKGTPFKEQEPSREGIDEVYQEIMAQQLFSSEQIESYITNYQAAEAEALLRRSEMDARLSNIHQEYREHFQEVLSDVEDRKSYVSLLRRYVKLYYFAAKFFQLEAHLHRFVIFAESMAAILIKQGKLSDLKQVLKHVEVSKGAVILQGEITNPQKGVKEPRPSKEGGPGGGAKNLPTTTIEAAIAELEERFNISKEDAIVIREVCEEVSSQKDIKMRITANYTDTLFLDRYEPTVKKQVVDEYEERDLWVQLDDPLYNDDGGIFSIMSKSIIQSVISNHSSQSLRY